MADFQLTQVEYAKLFKDLNDILWQFSEEPYLWLNKKLKSIQKPSDVYLLFSMVPRFVPRTEIVVRPGYFFDLQTTFGHNPKTWTADQIARLIILLEVGRDEAFDFNTILNTILETADYYEQVTIYKSVIFIPGRELFTLKVVDGVRTNISDVFDAIALENSYPYFFFEENAWNQMVLKAIFTGKPLKKIVGVDQKANKELAKMALGFAHERWAAGRSVSPDLWRLTSRFVDERNVNDIQKLIAGEEIEKKAAYLICDTSSNNIIKKLASELNYEGITWNEIN